MSDWQEEALYDSEYQDFAIARARRKLEAIEDGSQRLEPIGRLLGRTILTIVFLGLPALGLAYLAIDLYTRRRPEPGLGIFLGVIAAVLGTSAYFIVAGARPNTPKRALKIFYRSVGRANWRLARRLVVPSDFDDLERYPPELPGLGFAKRLPYVFRKPNEFGRFWGELVRYHSSPYCIAQVAKVHVQPVSERVAIVEFRLTLSMNTTLWWLLIFVAGPIIALIIDAVTRKTTRASMRKILIHNDDDWILLNGAWMGPEEDYVGWLTGEEQ